MDLSVSVLYLHNIFLPSQAVRSIQSTFTLLSASDYFYSVFLLCGSIHTNSILVALLRVISSKYGLSYP